MSNLQTRAHAAARLTLIVTILSGTALPQSFTGRIVGTVADSTGGVIASAQVRATELTTNRTHTVTANDAGNYAMSELPRGEYMIEVSAPGFKQFVRRGIVLSIGQQARVDVRLEIGAVTESVEVVADASLLETVDSVLGKVVDNRRITELPLNTRNVFSLLYLTPGVTGSVSTTYGTGYAINGARNSMLDILVDGVSTAHPTVNGFSGNSTFPPVEAIAELKCSARTIQPSSAGATAVSSTSSTNPAAMTSTAACSSSCATRNSMPTTSSTIGRADLSAASSGISSVRWSTALL